MRARGRLRASPIGDAGHLQAGAAGKGVAEEADLAAEVEAVEDLAEAVVDSADLPVEGVDSVEAAAVSADLVAEVLVVVDPVEAGSLS